MKEVIGADAFGGEVNLINKLAMAKSSRMETIGAPGVGSDKFDAVMDGPDVTTLNKIVETIWRIAELPKR